MLGLVLDIRITNGTYPPPPSQKYVGSAQAENNLNRKNSPLQSLLSDKAQFPNGYTLYTPPHGYKAIVSSYGSRQMSTSVWNLNRSRIFGGGQADADVIGSCQKQIEEFDAQVISVRTGLN